MGLSCSSRAGCAASSTCFSSLLPTSDVSSSPDIRIPSGSSTFLGFPSSLLLPTRIAGFSCYPVPRAGRPVAAQLYAAMHPARSASSRGGGAGASQGRECIIPCPCRLSRRAEHKLLSAIRMGKRRTMQAAKDDADAATLGWWWPTAGGYAYARVRGECGAWLHGWMRDVGGVRV